MNNIEKIFKTKKYDYENLLNNIIKNLSIEKSFCPSENHITKTDKFLSQNTKIVTGYADLVMDDDSAYFYLFDLIKNEYTKLKNSANFDQNISKIVQNCVFDYFGTGKPNDIERTFVYRDAYNKDKNVSIKNFCNTGNSMCLERACLAHNLLMILGYSDELVASDISLNMQRDLHTFNIVKLNDGKYIFDLVASKINDGPMPNPLMKKLKNEYNDEKISFVSQSGKLNTISYGKDILKQENEIDFEK